MPRCSRPGCLDPIDGSGWPDGEDGVLCQTHWEEDCSKSWWEMMTDGPLTVIVEDRG